MNDRSPQEPTAWLRLSRSGLRGGEPVGCQDRAGHLVIGGRLTDLNAAASVKENLPVDAHPRDRCRSRGAPPVHDLVGPTADRHGVNAHCRRINQPSVRHTFGTLDPKTHVGKTKRQWQGRSDVHAGRRQHAGRGLQRKVQGGWSTLEARPERWSITQGGSWISMR